MTIHSSFSIGEYKILCLPDQFPDSYADYAKHATFVDQIALHETDDTACFVAVQRGLDWPYMVILQRYNPAGFGFNPGVLLVPQTHRLFIGAGTRLLA